MLKCGAQISEMQGKVKYLKNKREGLDFEFCFIFKSCSFFFMDNYAHCQQEHFKTVYMLLPCGTEVNSGPKRRCRKEQLKVLCFKERQFPWIRESINTRILAKRAAGEMCIQSI